MSSFLLCHCEHASELNFVFKQIQLCCFKQSQLCCIITFKTRFPLTSSLCNFYTISTNSQKIISTLFILFNHFREYQHSFDPEYSTIMQYICTPTVEWYVKIWMMPTLLKVFALFLAVFSFMVVWSEVTFFSIDPVLSMFAVFINAAAQNYNYLCLEVSRHV